MQRFYFEQLEDSDETITLRNPNVLHQLNKVLRAKSGDEFVFFNGKDVFDYIFELKDIVKREAFFVKIGSVEKDIFPKKVINVVQSLSNKLEKIEFLLQKGTEIGISNFLFFKSERSLKLHISENKFERLKKIVVEASEQSGRNNIPEIYFSDDISLDDFKGQENIFFHTSDENSKKLKSLELKTDKNINLFVGPEGGFSDEEVKVFEENNFEKVYLGENILRTETVGVVVGFYLMTSS